MTQNELDRTAGEHLEFLWTTVAGCGEPAGRQADLSWQNSRGLNLTRKDFSFATLKKADLSGAVAEKASFYAADLQGAILRGCDLREADFWGTNLEGADLEGTYLEVDGGGFDWHSPADTAGIQMTVRTEEISSSELPPTPAKVAGANLAGAKFKGTVIEVVVVQKRRRRGRRHKRVAGKAV